MIRLVATILLSLCTLSVAYAAPEDFAKAKRALGQIKRGEKALQRAAKRLTANEKERLKQQARGDDSDSDGLENRLEKAFGSDLCNEDTDGDGVNDRDDRDEDNYDSDGDGVPDGLEVEVEGRITSFNAPILTVASTSGQITATTVFYRGLTSQADLIPGLCIEAEGRRDGVTFIIEKVKRKKDSSCGRGSNDDDSDDD